MGAPSSATAKTALGLSIGSGVLSLLQGNCNNGNVLGNLFGGCNNNNNRTLEYISGLQSEVAQLKSEKYSDQNDKAVYQQTLADNRYLREEMFANINPLIAETHAKAVSDADKMARMEEQIKCLNKTQEMQAEITAGKINEATLALNSKIDVTEATNLGRFKALDQTIACIAGKVDSITKTVVDTCQACPGVVYAAQSVPAAGTTWYPSCVSPVAPATAAA